MSGYYVTNLANVLRAAGLRVVEHPGWQRRGHGGLATTRPQLVLHHDASPKGPSETVADYLQAQIDTGSKRGDAQLWVSTKGVWHVIAAGKAYHAGVTRPGAPGNSTTLGIETDHTNGESWPPAMLDSIRRGEAALLRAYGHSAAGLHFHKSICWPKGRKVDPHGLDLARERQIVGALIAAPTATPAATVRPASAAGAPAKAPHPAGRIASKYLRRGMPASWSVARYKEVAFARHGRAYQAAARRRWGAATRSQAWDAFAEQVTRDHYQALARATGDASWLSGDISTPGPRLLERLGFEVVA